MKRDNRNRAVKYSNKVKRKNKVNSSDSQNSLLDSKIARSKKNIQSNKNQKTSLIIIALLIFIFFGLLVIIIIKMPEQPQVSQTDSLDEPLETVDYHVLLTFNNNEGSNYHPFADQFVYLSQNNIQLLNHKKEVIYSENIDLIRPVNVQNDEYFLIADRESGQVIVLNHQGKQFSLSLDGVFAGAYFSEGDYVAIIEENQNQPGFVHIISLDAGHVHLTLQFFESGYPLAIVFNDNLEYFDVLLSNTSSSTLQTLINRYDLEGNQLGQIKLTEYPYLYAQIFYDQEDNIFIAGASNILVLDFSENKVIETYNTGRIIQIVNTNEIVFFASNRIDDDIFLVEWSETEETFVEKKLELLNQIDKISYNDSVVAISGNNRIQLIDLVDKKILLDQYVDTDILRMTIVDNSLILISESDIKSIKF